jgi:N-acetyl sugar amidotransferase
MEIKFCKNCFYSTQHPLGLTIDQNTGICSGCLIHKEKYKINWIEKLSKLKKIVKEYKSKNNFYDCIVPVSGANDSFYILYLVKQLGLNPLLVSYNHYFNTDIGIKNLANLKTIFDCDLLTLNVSPKKVKKITKHTLVNYGNMYWPAIAGKTVFPIQIACKYKIPLIIWGAHQGLEQVGMFSHNHEVEMSRWYRKNHDLFGIEAEDLIKTDGLVKEEDVIEYLYPDEKDLNSIGVRGIYLGNYIKWDVKSQHERMVKKFKYKSISFQRTIDAYDHVDCFNYMNIHDLLKIYKHGYSKITDHVTREIRYNRISRFQGLQVIKKYEIKKPEFISLFSKWLDIDTDSLIFLLNRFRNKNYWKKVDINEWIFNGWSKKISIKNENQKLSKKLTFNHNSAISFKQYITVGKGWPL